MATITTTERVTVGDVADRLLDLFSGTYDGREDEADNDVQGYMAMLNITTDEQGTMSAAEARRVVGALVSDFIGLPTDDAPAETCEERGERLDREEMALAAIDAEVWSDSRGRISCKHHRMPGMKPTTITGNLADACWHDVDHGRVAPLTDAEVRAYARVR